MRRNWFSSVCEYERVAVGTRLKFKSFQQQRFSHDLSTPGCSDSTSELQLQLVQLHSALNGDLQIVVTYLNTMSSATVSGNSSGSSYDGKTQADLVGGPFAVIESDPGQFAQEYRRNRNQKIMNGLARRIHDSHPQDWNNWYSS